MPEYRRARGGGTYFFTVATYMRQPILCLEDSIHGLKDIVAEVRLCRPFEIMAWVTLPDHLHTIWRVPDGDPDYSTRWALIKKGFTKKSRLRLNTPKPSESRTKRREAAIWQRRFWEHRIKDDIDLKRHVEYIHYNPVKHGLVKSPQDWTHSSFHEYVSYGVYPSDWGVGDIELEDVGSE